MARQRIRKAIRNGARQCNRRRHPSGCATHFNRCAAFRARFETRRLARPHAASDADRLHASAIASGEPLPLRNVDASPMPRPAAAARGAGRLQAAIVGLRLLRLEHVPHPAKQRSRLAAGERRAVDRRDREHFLGRRRQPQLAGGKRFRARDRPHLEAQSGRAREVERRVVGDARQDMVVLGRRDDLAVDHAPARSTPTLRSGSRRGTSSSRPRRRRRQAGASARCRRAKWSSGRSAASDCRLR